MALCGSHEYFFSLHIKKKSFRHSLKYTLKTYEDKKKIYTDTTETSHIFLRNPVIPTKKKPLCVINCHGKQRSSLIYVYCQDCIY